ncbi:MAG: hypothetical protein GYA55_01045, partial [SAR324 cluster bacterium]|nr:hypothetical protein [SAR324 cluster bacterium]
MQNLLGFKQGDLRIRIVPNDCNSHFNGVADSTTPLIQLAEGAVLISERVFSQTTEHGRRGNPHSTVVRLALGQREINENFLVALTIAKIAAGILLMKNPNSPTVRNLRRAVTRFLKVEDEKDLEVCVLNIMACIRLCGILKKTRGKSPIRPEILEEAYQRSETLSEDRELGLAFLKMASNLAYVSVSADSYDRQEKFFWLTESAYVALSFLQQGASSAVALLFTDMDSDKMKRILNQEQFKEKFPCITKLDEFIDQACNLHRALKHLVSLPQFPAIPSESELRPNYNVQGMINYRLHAIVKIAKECNCEFSQLMAIDLARNIAEARSLCNMGNEGKSQLSMEIEAVYGTMAEHYGVHDFHRYLVDLLKKYTDVEGYRKISEKVAEAIGDRASAERYLREKCQIVKASLEASYLVQDLHGECRTLEVGVVSSLAVAHRLAGLSRDMRPAEYSSSDLFLVGDLKTISSVMLKQAELREEWLRFLCHCRTNVWIQDRIRANLDLDKLEKALNSRIPQFETVLRISPDEKLEELNFKIKDLLQKLKGISLGSHDFNEEDVFSSIFDICSQSILGEDFVDALNLPALARDLLRFGIVVSNDLYADLPQLCNAAINAVGIEDRRWNDDRLENKSIHVHENGKVVGVLKKVPMEVEGGALTVGEIQAHSVSYPFFGGRPVQRYMNHCYRRLGSTVDGQGNNYLDDEVNPKGNWRTDIGSALKSTQHSNHFCLIMENKESPIFTRMKRMQSMEGGEALNIPIVLSRALNPDREMRFLDVLAAFSLAYEIPLKDLASVRWGRIALNNKEEILQIALDDVVFSGDTFKMIGKDRVPGAQSIYKHCLHEISQASMPLRVFQLRDVPPRTGRSRRNKVKKGIQPSIYMATGREVVHEIFGVTEPEVMKDYITEINRLFVLL